VKVVEKVKGFLDSKCETLATGFYTDVITSIEEWEDAERAIESPVEQLFYIEWLFRKFHNHDYEELYLEPQHQDPSTNGFRVDFCFNFIQEVLAWPECGLKLENGRMLDVITAIKYPKLAIEIDGHIWHEKTKEQVIRDKKRERILIANGWTVLRFSGSEVYKNPSKCVDEMLSVTEKMREEYHDILWKKYKKGTD